MRRMILTPRPIAQRELRQYAHTRGFCRAGRLRKCDLESRLVSGDARDVAPNRFVLIRRPHPAYTRPTRRAQVRFLRLSTLPAVKTLFPEIDSLRSEGEAF